MWNLTAIHQLTDNGSFFRIDDLCCIDTLPIRSQRMRSSPRLGPVWPDQQSRAAIGNTRLASELEVLLALGAAHGTDALIGAMRRAVAFRRFRAADVRSILAAGVGTPQPRPAGDALILDLPVAPMRSLDAYTVAPAAGGGAPS